jgi:small GTP-binding protein
MSADTHVAWAELALAEHDALRAAEHLRDAQMMQPEHPALPDLLVQTYGLLAPSLSELPPAPLITAADLTPWLDELSSLVTRQPSLHEHLPALHQLRRHLDQPLSIAIVGEFNAGKSTLINAFLREHVLATGVLPTTPSIHVIRYGSRPVARWTDLSGRVHELSFAQAASRVKTDPESIQQLEFCFPHPDLLGVHFWDTPGFNAPDEAHEERALAALNDADAIIWLMDASQALSDSELQRIRLITAPQERLLVVINKIDRPGLTTGDLAEVRAHIERGLRASVISGDNFTGGGPAVDPWAGMFAVSGLRALQLRDAAGQGDPEWLEFETAIRSTFFDRAARLKSFEVMRGLQRVARAVLENTADEVARVQELRTHVAQVRRLIARFETAAESSVIPGAGSQLDAQIVEHRQQLFRELQELRMPSRFGGIAPRQLQADDQALLRRRAADGVARLVRRAADSLAAATSRTEQELITTMAGLAVSLGSVHGRTQRARLDAFLQAAAGARQLFERGVVNALIAADSARIEAIGDGVLNELDSAAESRREGILLRWLPLRGHAWSAAALSWCREYVAIAVRLCDHVDRDLDILALDLEHRIVRPFSMVASTTAHMLSNDESTKS